MICAMPHLNKTVVVDLIARKYPSRDGIRRLAAETNIPYGSLRNAVHGTDQVGMGRVYEIARALGVNDNDAREVLLAADPNPPDGTPNKPPEPRKIPKPDPKRDPEKKGPQRHSDRYAS